MSTEEQQAAIGRTVEDYAACKKKLAALLMEASRAGRAMSALGQMLQSANEASVNLNGYASQHTANLPTADALTVLANDISTEAQRKQQLHAQLKNMGVEPKD